MTANAPDVHHYYDFEVSLQHIEPRIWRRFLLIKTATFQDLHKAIQDAGPWTESHLFAFRTERFSPAVAGLPIDDPMIDDDPDPDAKKVKLSSYFKGKRDWVLYEYDFGDSWHHDVKLLGTVSLPYKFKRALLGGERAFPPEDCGGTSGYERCVEFRKTGFEEFDEGTMGPWLGEWQPEDFDEGTMGPWLGEWQPEDFDLAKVKAKFDR